MRWRGAGDVAASQGLADGQAIAAKHRQGDAARHLASERCMGRDGDENKNYRLSACVRLAQRAAWPQCAVMRIPPLLVAANVAVRAAR